jgi:hypothetical protein
VRAGPGIDVEAIREAPDVAAAQGHDSHEPNGDEGRHCKGGEEDPAHGRLPKQYMCPISGAKLQVPPSSELRIRRCATSRSLFATVPLSAGSASPPIQRLTRSGHNSSRCPGCGYIELVQSLAKMRRGGDAGVLPQYAGAESEALLSQARTVLGRVAGSLLARLFRGFELE